jgi:hypothetical protein
MQFQRLPHLPKLSNFRGVGFLIALLFVSGAWESFAQTRPYTEQSSSTTSKPVFEEWVIVVLDGKTCGFGSTVTTKKETAAGPEFITSHQEEFVAKRMGVSLKITETSRVTEDADGGVLSFDEVSDA